MVVATAATALLLAVEKIKSQPTGGLTRLLKKKCVDQETYATYERRAAPEHLACTVLSREK